MSFISEARSLQLIPPPLPHSPIPKETPIVRNLECNIVTAQRRWAGLERGEKVKPKSRPYSGMGSEPGRNVRGGWKGGGYLESQICLMQKAEGEGGAEIWGEEGGERMWRRSFRPGNLDGDDIQGNSRNAEGETAGQAGIRGKGYLGSAISKASTSANRFASVKNRPSTGQMCFEVEPGVSLLDERRMYFD